MPGYQQLDLCHACLQTLPRSQHNCPVCANSFNHCKEICDECLKHPPVQDSTHAVFLYQGSVPYLITALKFRHDYTSGRVLGSLMAQHFSSLNNRPDLLIPVPLHRLRYQQRGYNQSIELARPIAQKLNIPLELTACVRRRPTQAQSNLSGKERRQNIKGVFHIQRPLPYNHVAIIDDVMTTGSTVSELAKILKQHGVSRVDVWACAKTRL